MRTFIILVLMLLIVSSVQALPLAPYEKLPVVAKTQVLDRQHLSSGFNELLPYLLPSPDQGDAGTCLFMAHTGVVEWWLAKLAGQRYPTIQGPFDLSERFSANLKTLNIGASVVTNWRTDTIYRFNAIGYSLRNRDYPFTQGYYVRNDQGERVVANTQTEGAFYGINYNWIPLFTDDLPRAELPFFEREVIYADPKQNQWNIGGAPVDIVKVVKQKLVDNKAPIIVIYNHMGYWHTVIIAGFNDSLATDCPYSKAFPSYMKKRAGQLKELADQTEEPKEKKRLLGKAKRFLQRANTAEQLFHSLGGCKRQGVFYVRDSIYPDKNLPLYDYDLEHQGEESHYSSTIIAREYEWLRIFSNHIYQIRVQVQ